MSDIRWGVIGCGAVCEKKSAPALAHVPGSALVAVMRRDAARAADYARRHNVPRWYDDAARLIADPEVDAVYIATPPDTHLEYTRAAAAAGKPVYVEKPMARNHAECLAMIDACERAGVPLFVAYYRRALPTFLKVRDLLADGGIGTPRFVSIYLTNPVRDDEKDPSNLPWRVLPHLSGGGHFHDLASHQLDLLDFLLGPILDPVGVAANQAGLYPADDVVAAAWRHATGVLGSGIWCFTVAESERADAIEIVGDRGRIAFAAFSPEPVRLFTPSGEQSFDIPYPDHVQQPLIKTVVAALRGEGDCPSTGVSAARASAVLDAIIACRRPAPAPLA